MVKATLTRDCYLEMFHEFLKLNKKKINTPLKQWAKNLSRHLTKEKIQMQMSR